MKAILIATKETIEVIKASEYILEMWLVGDLGIFEDKELAAIRIYTNQGYEDIKLGKRIAKLKELYSVYKSAL